MKIYLNIFSRDFILKESMNEMITESLIAHLKDYLGYFRNISVALTLAFCRLAALSGTMPYFSAAGMTSTCPGWVLLGLPIFDLFSS